jgi:predicted 2-oxoglutarate/Fe(II)-dependent dioxygenase YbiX
MKETYWGKHYFNDVITNEETTHPDDLEMSYQEDAVTNELQQIFEQCAKEYLATVSPYLFELQALTRIRFNRYKVGTNMKMHHDHIHTIFDGERKGIPILSMVALLNDDFEGGDFVMFEGKKVKLSAGDIIVFPSNFLYSHGVTTVTKGTRYSCVSWGY